MLKRHRFILIVLAHLALACMVGAAQEKESAEMKPAEESGARLSSPPADLGHVYLEELDKADPNSQLVLIPGASLQEYYQVLDRLQGLTRDSGIPQEAIRSLSATGRVVGNRVDLKVRLSITVETQREQWVKIPLRFDQAVLRRIPGSVDGVRQRIELDSAGGVEGTLAARSGYVLWLRGLGEGKVETEEVELELSVPLTERRFVLSVPNTAVSEFRLTVPIANAEAEVAAGTVLNREPQGEDATDLVLTGFRGEIDVSWRPTNGNASAAAPVLTSNGFVEGWVDRHSVEFKARLTVSMARPDGRELSRFLVRLPAGAVLVEEQYPDYTITDATPQEEAEAGKQEDAQGSNAGEDDSESNETAPKTRLVEVVLAKPVANSGSASVTLRATSEVSENGRFSLAGFAVSKAIDQRGYVVIRARGDGNVRCDEGRGVTPVSEVPELQDSEDVVAKYRYYEQPFSLAARVLPRQVRIGVEPHYDLSIGPDQARLVAKLKYAVRGDKAFQFRIDPKGWKFDQVGPDPLVVQEEWAPDESGVLTIRLQEGVMSELIELSVNASRPIDPKKQSLELPMPKPDATTLSSLTLNVFPADNVELRQDAEKTKGLEKVAPPASLDVPVSRQEPLCYRGAVAQPGEAGVVGEVTFAATMSIRRQEIAAGGKTEIRITSVEASVRQRLIYDVKYEPTLALLLRVPQEMAVTYSLDGNAVTAVAVEKSPVAGEFVSRRIVTPSPRQGQLELVAEYSVPIRGLEPDQLLSVPCVIPLIVPEGVTYSGHRVHVTTEEGIGFWLMGGSPWQKVLGDEVGQKTTSDTEFVTHAPEEHIALGVQQRDPDTFGSALVEAAWIQTWMDDSQRGDRVVYRVVSDRRTLVLSLPSAADTDFLRVLVDGRDAVYELSDHQVRVSLPPESPARARVLELRYLVKSRPARGRMKFEFARLLDNVWVQRIYWQLVLPKSEHVVSAPKDFTAEYRWAWTGAWWGRIPTKEQADLEKWIGTASGEQVPKATSRYLFSKFGPAESAELATASRTWIVGAASGATLLVGLLLIYFPRTRHPLFGLILIVAIGGGAVVWPGESLLLAQATGMGLVLSLLGAVLYRATVRGRRRSVRRDLPSSILERGSTQAQFGSSEVELLRSTATEPDAAAVHAQER
ncbi:MAG: hypothetical protein GXX96_15740 [Planctomycetaceae bacterium]|nr:hypothetical protein [Planctomycetaceae bacterium]